MSSLARLAPAPFPKAGKASTLGLFPHLSQSAFRGTRSPQTGEHQPTLGRDAALKAGAAMPARARDGSGLGG